MKFFFNTHPKICSLIFQERKEGRERERKNINVREKHWSLASCMCLARDWTHNPGMCPDWASNSQHLGVQDDAPTNWATWPGQFMQFFSIIFIKFMTFHNFYKLQYHCAGHLIRIFLVLSDVAHLATEGRSSACLIHFSVSRIFSVKQCVCVWALALWMRVTFIGGGYISASFHVQSLLSYLTSQLWEFW